MNNAMTIPTRRLALLLAINTALAPFAVDAYLPAMPAMATDFTVDMAHIQWSLSIFLVGFALGQLLGGPLSDRLGRKPVMLSGIACFLLASFAIPWAPDVTALWGLRFIQALGGGASVVNSSAVVRDCFSGRDSARVLSMVAIIMLMVPLVAPLMGSFLQQLGGWEAIFWVLGGYGVLAWWVLHRYLPETRVRQPAIQPWYHVWPTYRVILRHRQGMGFLLTGALSMAGLLTFVTAAPEVYIQVYGLKETWFPWVFGLNVIFIIVSNRLNLRLLGHHAPVAIMRRGLQVQWTGAALATVLVLLGWDFSWALMLPFLIMACGVMGLILPNAVASLLEQFPERSGAANALLGATQFLLGGLLGSLVGVIGHQFAEPSALPMLGVMLFCFSVSYGCLRGMACRPD